MCPIGILEVLPPLQSQSQLATLGINNNQAVSFISLAGT